MQMPEWLAPWRRNAKELDEPAADLRDPYEVLGCRPDPDLMAFLVEPMVFPWSRRRRTHAPDARNSDSL